MDDASDQQIHAFGVSMPLAASPLQPVAPTAGPHRSLRELLADIRTGATRTRPLSFAEEKSLRTWAGRQEEAGLRRIKEHLARGARRAAEREAHKLQRTLGAKLLALWRTVPSHLRPKGGMSAEDREFLRAAKLEMMMLLVNKVGSFSQPASALVFAKRKRGHKPGSPDRRALFSFGWADKARQRLLATTLHPFASFHPSQFLLQRHAGKRGRSAACEALLDALKGLADTHVFVQLDVRDFYGSIRHEWLENNLGLPQEVIRHHVHTSRMTISWDRSALAHLSDGVRRELARRGIPQGSALSPLIAEMVMADILRGLADRLDGVPLFTYSDNLGIIVPRTEAAVVVEHLRDAFARHDAGPFELTSTSPKPATGEIKFLGRWWRNVDGKPHQFVPEGVANARALLIIEEAMVGGTAVLPRSRARTRSLAAEWAGWDGADAWRGRVLASLDATVPRSLEERVETEQSHRR